MAFRSAIEGLDKVIRSDILPPKVILVTGPPGSMKTSFCYTLMSRYLKDTGEFGLYTTLEETVQSHLRNMESLGVELSMNMQISDFTDLREIDAVVGPEDQTDYLAFIERMIGHYRKVHGHKFKLFALDSLGALYSLMENTSNMRKRMFYFFKMLRDNELTCLVVMERAPNGESQLLGNEGFLVDGIVVLGLDRSRGKLVRYLQVEKTRSVDHSMEKHAIEVRKGGLTVLGPIFEAGGKSCATFTRRAWEARRHARTSEGTINGRRIDPRRARCTEESGRKPEVPGCEPKGARGGPSGSIRQNRGRPPSPRTGTDLALGRAGLARRPGERAAGPRERARAERAGDHRAGAGIRFDETTGAREGELAGVARAGTRQAPRIPRAAGRGHRPTGLGGGHPCEGHRRAED